MREKMLTDSAFRSPLLVVVLLLLSLVPFSSLNLRSADAAVTTSITQTTGTGNLGTTITQAGYQYNITGGTRAGTNLFHSFGNFSVGSGDIANFQNTLVNGSYPLTSNILGRVTGGNISNIFGTIQTTNFGNANLFLMNPAGFLFGPNAMVNVGGMMTFTTADYIQLANGGRFNANPNTVPGDNLISADVVAFGFLNTNLHPAAITFEGGKLTVAGGTGLTLVGGDISLVPDASGTASGITAPGRPIQITSVAGPGEVTAGTGVPAAGMALGTITLGQGTTLDTSYNSGAPVIGDGSGGAISIRGGQLIATAATITTNPAPGSTGAGGDVTIAVTGSASFTDSFIQTGPIPDFVNFVGSGGSVSIAADASLTMTNTTIDASAFLSGGDAGSVTLNSLNGPISLTDSFISATASAPGNGGAVTITGKDVTLTRSGIFTDVDTGSFDLTVDDPALGLVHPGAVTVTAQNTVTFSGSYANDPFIPVISATAFGTLVDAGAVTITGKTVNLSNGSILTNMNEGSIPSPGNGGPIEIRGNNVNLSGFTLQSINAGFFASTGKGGNILIRGADSLLADNIQLTSSIVDAASVSGGGGGSIQFQTKSLTLSDASVLRTSTFATGAGGIITVGGADTVTIESGSRVQTNSIGNGLPEKSGGSAGDIVIETENLAVLSGGQITAGTFQNSTGIAGNIVVHGTNGAANSVMIDGAGSGIFTSTEGTGAGGNIFVNANSVTLQNGGTLSATTSGAASSATGGSITVNASNQVSMTGGASISASSTGPANAGNISINAGQRLEMNGSSITTEAAQAAGGNIDIRAVDRVSLVNSTISTSVLGGSGGGGNITIDPTLISLQNNSSILAQAVLGNGGNIQLIANLLLVDPSSVISASSEFGQSGTIQSPTSNLAGTVSSLPSSTRQGQALQAQRCAMLNAGGSSSFIIAGRDQVPTEPGGWMVSSLDALGTGEGSVARGKGEGLSRLSGSSSSFGAFGPKNELDQTNQIDQIDQMDQPNLPPVLSLRRLTPAGFLTQRFADSEASGCRS